MDNDFFEDLYIKDANGRQILNRDKALALSKKYEEILRSTTIQQARNDHYVPQFILRKFSSSPQETPNREKKIFMLNKNTKIITRRPISKIASSIGYDSILFSEFIDKEYIESKMKILLDSLIEKKFTLNKEDKLLIHKFMVVTLSRSPFFIDSIGLSFEQHMRGEFNESIREESEYLKKILHPDEMHITRESVKRTFIDILSYGRLAKFWKEDCKTEILHTCFELIIGDNPLIPELRNSFNERDAYGFVHSRFFFPISREKVLMLEPNNQSNYTSNKFLDENQVRKLNQSQYNFATKEIYAYSKKDLQSFASD